MPTSPQLLTGSSAPPSGDVGGEQKAGRRTERAALKLATGSREAAERFDDETHAGGTFTGSTATSSTPQTAHADRTDPTDHPHHPAVEPEVEAFGQAPGERPVSMPSSLRAHLLGSLEAAFGSSRVGLWLGDGSGLCLDPVDGVLTLQAPHRFACERLSQNGMADALAKAAAEAGLPPQGPHRACQGPLNAADGGPAQPPHRHLRLRVADAGCGNDFSPAFPSGAREGRDPALLPPAPLGGPNGPRPGGQTSDAETRAGSVPAPFPSAGEKDAGSPATGRPVGAAPPESLPREQAGPHAKTQTQAAEGAGTSWDATAARDDTRAGSNPSLARQLQQGWQSGRSRQAGQNREAGRDGQAGPCGPAGPYGKAGPYGPAGPYGKAGPYGQSGKHQPAGRVDSTHARRPGPTRGGHRLEDFVTGPCNELAFAAAAGLAAGDHDGPLFLHGACGLGKTHLLGGIVSAWREQRRGSRGNGRVHATTGERFTNRFIDHARRGDLAAFRREVRGCSLLAVDDVHFVAGKQKTQNELLHCFDAALAAGVPVVFASDRHPRELSAMGTALSSRCLQGLVAEIRPPAASMRRQLIRELGLRRGLSIDESSAAALEALAGPGVREIEGLLAKVDVLGRLGRRRTDPNAFSSRPSQTASSAAGEALAGALRGQGGERGSAPGAPKTLGALGTVGAVGTVAVGPALVERLRRLERPPAPSARLAPGTAGITAIAEAVGQALGIPPADALGAGRSRPIVQARALVAHLARELTAMSYPEIARAMGRPSHSSVITADKRVRTQLRADASVNPVGAESPISLRDLVADLRDRLT